MIRDLCLSNQRSLAATLGPQNLQQKIFTSTSIILSSCIFQGMLNRPWAILCSIQRNKCFAHFWFHDSSNGSYSNSYSLWAYESTKIPTARNRNKKLNQTPAHLRNWVVTYYKSGVEMWVRATCTCKQHGGFPYAVVTILVSHWGMVGHLPKRERIIDLASKIVS